MFFILPQCGEKRYRAGSMFFIVAEQTRLKNPFSQRELHIDNL
jgi:hypothetical protein